MKVLKALDLGPTPSWVKVSMLADWALELSCERCGESGTVKQRDLVKQQERAREWIAHHSRCKEGR